MYYTCYLNTEELILFFEFFFLILQDESPFCGATDTVLVFPGSQSHSVFPNRMLPRLCGVQWMPQIHLWCDSWHFNFYDDKANKTCKSSFFQQFISFNVTNVLWSWSFFLLFVQSEQGNVSYFNHLESYTGDITDSVTLPTESRYQHLIVLLQYQQTWINRQFCLQRVLLEWAPVTNMFLCCNCTIIIDSNAGKFCYNEFPFKSTVTKLFCIFSNSVVLTWTYVSVFPLSGVLNFFGQ